jgi:hypothetical protein
MFDGDAYMHEGGEAAPTVFEVADKLALQGIGRFQGHLSWQALKRPIRRTDWKAGEQPSSLLTKPCLLRHGSLLEGNLGTGRELTGLRTRALGENPKDSTPLPPFPLL